MRFLLDESVSLACASSLRAQAHEAVHVIEVGLGGAPDTDVARHAKSNDLILVTRDHHFTNAARFPPESLNGIIYIRPGNLSSREEAALLVRTVTNLPSEGIAGHLVTVSRHRLTIR